MQQVVPGRCAQGDMRVPQGECLRWGLSADAEALAWLPALDTGFVVSTEDGTVAAFDARRGSGWRRPPPLPAGASCLLPPAAAAAVPIAPLAICLFSTCLQQCRLIRN